MMKMKKTSVDINDLLLEKVIDLVIVILVFLKDALLYLKHDFFHHFLKRILFNLKIYANAKVKLDNVINEYNQILLLQIILNMISAQPKEHQSENEATIFDLIS